MGEKSFSLPLPGKKKKAITVYEKAILVNLKRQGTKSTDTLIVTPAAALNSDILGAWAPVRI